MTLKPSDRVRGVLVGLAIGDALGAPVEFDGPQVIYNHREELFELPGGGYFHWAPGEFTDDTQMAIVLARHLEQHGGRVDQDALAKDFAGWLEGAIDVGVQTRRVLITVCQGADWRREASQLPSSAQGNGCLMRVAPVALAARSRHDASVLAREQAEITHPSLSCLEATGAYAWILRGVLETGELDIDGALQEVKSEAVREALEQSRTTKVPTMSGRVLVLPTLTGALWAVQRATCFDDAVWNAVSLGHDADTVGAVAGALAGARWGYSGITPELARKLHTRHPALAGQYPELLVELAERLAAGWLTRA